ncbi:cation:proton antiporter [Convivina intestini]|uniref:CPA1 family monovalent cation:H+ antiporter n=1 Tax=Convivina intestini TaxID=1505726 RepID=A0A2U1DCK5_9LACO|nr:sodium:proton antiporter [Convivina intestini]PVY85418.1 CPA1 family monovalent cation:H+ antiporter [Convivina intestini]CAH1853149.1 hypothetical protein R077811_00638 [Convivina intestini]SDB85329.1 sodium/proton antiporter, CPA1 family (TC 2.A.36) [Leuconostocaceae bacterium R-53105]
MTNLYLIAFILVGVITANIVKPFFPKIPESFVLIIIGALFSFIPIFNEFTLEPEFFMLLIIAPLMFMDGKEQSIRTIRANFRLIIELSVTLAIFTALIVGVLTDRLEAHWSFPLSIALAAIVVPTDAVAVKSITSGLSMPKGVDRALGLESLFNDATGLVMLNLALSVLQQGHFSLVNGINQFLIVAGGGVLVGILASLIIIKIRTYLTTHAVNAAATIIPINILTPFAIYLLAEHWGVSGILAVVASGIVHNWDSSRLRLNSTEVQLTTSTIWETLTTILNEVVFLLLGLSLPAVINEMIQIGFDYSFELIGLSLAIYTVMFIGRFVWVRVEKSQRLQPFFGHQDQPERFKNARLFGISGVHGTITLAMAFSLPTTINGQPFPFRTELIIIATLVILISMLVASLMLPRLLPREQTDYTPEEINQIRDQMIDYAMLRSQEQISNRDIREAISAQLNSQKTNLRNFDQVRYSEEYLTELNDIADFVSSYTHGDYVNATYSDEVINMYNKILQKTLLNPNRRRHPIRSLEHQFRRIWHEMRFHISTGTITKKQRKSFYKKRLNTDEKFAEKVKTWKANQEVLLQLNNDVMQAVDTHLDDILRENLQSKTNSNELYLARKTMDRFFTMIQHDFHQKQISINSDTFIQVFRYEYDYVQKGVQDESIKPAIANILFNEINQAQALQLMKNKEETLAIE